MVKMSFQIFEIFIYLSVVYLILQINQKIFWIQHDYSVIVYKKKKNIALSQARYNDS